MKKKIDRFVIVEALSEAGGGSVYKADELLPGDIRRPVALKVLPVLPKDDKAAESRFFDEVKLLVAFSGNPNIVTVYSIGLCENLPWIAMEYLPLNLAKQLGDQPFASAEVARMIEHVGQGLATIHGLTPPMLHNDLKPANVLIDAGCNYKIADFGLAGLVSVEKTRPLATVRYAAPELLSRELGKTNPSTDLYALGHIAYEMALGGKVYRQQFPAVYDPFQHRTSADGPAPKWMAWHCSFTTVPAPIHSIRPDFPHALSGLIAKMMTKPIAERYASAPEMLADLRKISAPIAPTASPIPLAATSTQPQNSGSTTHPAHAAPVPATAGTTERFYVRLRGRVSGPYDLATLQRQIRQGLVSRLHQVSTDRVSWRNVDKIEGLTDGGPR